MNMPGRPAILVLLVTVAPLLWADDITMDQAIARALLHNRELAAAAIQLGLSEQALVDAHDEFAWTVKPGISATRNRDSSVLSAGVTARRRVSTGTEVEATIQAADDDGATTDSRRGAEARIGLRQPLLRGSRREVNLDGVLRAEAGRKTALRSFEERRAALVLSVVQAHQDLARLQDQLVFDEQALQRYTQLRKLTATRERQGRASRVDSLRVDFQYGKAEASLNNTRERLDSQRRELCELIGVPLATSLAAVPGPRLDVDGADPAAAEGLAFSNRLDYAEALQAVSEARRGIRVARHRLLPTVDVLAGYGVQGRGASYADALALEEDTWSVGIAGDTELGRRAEYSQWRSSQLDAQGAEFALAALEERIRREAQQAVYAYERACAQAGFADRNLELARSRAKLSRRMFELGRGDNFTATDAEAELLRAQSEALNLQAEASVAAYRLKRVTGTLLETPPELKPLPAPSAMETAAR